MGTTVFKALLEVLLGEVELQESWESTGSVGRKGILFWARRGSPYRGSVRILECLVSGC